MSEKKRMRVRLSTKDYILFSLPNEMNGLAIILSRKEAEELKKDLDEYLKD